MRRKGVATQVRLPLAPMEHDSILSAVEPPLKRHAIMYHAHWGLQRSPFAGGEAPQFFAGESQTEALARLRFVAEQRRHALLTAGRGTLIGPIIGAFVVNLAKSWFTVSFPEYWLFFLGLLFIVVTLMLPQGLVGLWKKLMDKKGAPA